jgi:hypothetical protein
MKGTFQAFLEENEKEKRKIEDFYSSTLTMHKLFSIHASGDLFLSLKAH